MVWWNHHKLALPRVGLELLPDGLALACSSGTVTDAAITTVTLLPCAVDQRESVLVDFVSQQKLQNAVCNLVLPPSDYQLLLVEAPQVPDEEMRAAVRWRLKDLINIPLESAVVDLFNLPLGATRSGKRMIFVVVTELQKVQELLTMVAATGLKISVIDIAEMALRNLTLLLPPEQTEDRGVAVVRIQQGKGNLGLYRNGNLYLSRQFELNYGGGLLDELPDEDLILEMQRSVDYAERQMGQTPPSAIYLCGDNISGDKITDGIKRGLAAPVCVLPLQSLISSEQNDAILQSCAGAIGGALRAGKWT